MERSCAGAMEGGSVDAVEHGAHPGKSGGYAGERGRNHAGCNTDAGEYGSTHMKDGGIYPVEHGRDGAKRNNAAGEHGKGGDAERNSAAGECGSTHMKNGGIDVVEHSRGGDAGHNSVAGNTAVLI